MENESGLPVNLRTRVETELEQYVYSVRSDSVGNPMSDESVSAQLTELRDALVEPYWTNVEVRDTFEQVALKESPRRRGAVVADDRRGMFLLWNPIDNDFFLAQDIRGVLTSLGVGGDAVGCFLSR